MPGKKTKKDRKYPFVLKNVNPEKIMKRFGIEMVSNITIDNDITPVQATRIDDLSSCQSAPEVMSFLDEAKKMHKCVLSMIDFNTGKVINKTGKKYRCFWDRHDIPTNIKPIGCPLRYIPPRITKTYYSEISKSKYTIKEYITPARARKLFKKEMDIVDSDTDDASDDENDSDSDSESEIKNESEKPSKKGKKEKKEEIFMQENGYYLSDGVFCSFNCAMAYIASKKDDSMYYMSETLLLKAYNDAYPDQIPKISCAPHWKKLGVHGGELNSIVDYRKSFNKIEYENMGRINIIPEFKSVGVLFEEKLKF